MVVLRVGAAGRLADAAGCLGVGLAGRVVAGPAGSLGVGPAGRLASVAGEVVRGWGGVWPQLPLYWVEASSHAHHKHNVPA